MTSHYDSCCVEGQLADLLQRDWFTRTEMRCRVPFRYEVAGSDTHGGEHARWPSKHRHASVLSKSVPLKVTAITLSRIPNWSAALQMAPPSPYLTNMSETRGVPELQTRGNTTIKMVSSCSERRRRVPQDRPQPWWRENAVDAVSLCFRWSGEERACVRC